jgi:hypothetical protein
LGRPLARKKEISMTLVANYDNAGNSRFCSHILLDDESKTLCGIKCWGRRGDWQDTGDKDTNVGCLRCKRIAEKAAQPALANRRKARVGFGKSKSVGALRG